MKLNTINNIFLFTDSFKGAQSLLSSLLEKYYSESDLQKVTRDTNIKEILDHLSSLPLSKDDLLNLGSIKEYFSSLENLESDEYVLGYLHSHNPKIKF